ncbi:fibronectin type III domain-containing protein [Chitinophaga lutea]
MTRILHLLLALSLLLLGGRVEAQTTLNPADPVVTYNGSNAPAEPAWGKIGKWIKTTRMSWNTSSYKCYIYKGMAFRLKFPKTYQPGVADGKKYPVYLFWHGLGEADDIYDNEYQLLWGGEKFKNAVDDGTFDGFLIYPQSAGLWGDTEYDKVKELLDSMATYTKADLQRVVVNGLSSGGQGVWAWTIRYPQLTAASLPMSAASWNYTNSIDQYKWLPMWLFQGGLDGNPAPYTTNQLVNFIQTAGGNLKFSFYPNDDHNSWVSAWNEADFIPFMKRAHQLKPYPLFGDSTFCPGGQITIGISPGFTAYEWRKDGNPIPNSNSNSIVVTQPGLYGVRAQNNFGWTDWSPVPLTVAYKPNTAKPVILTTPALSTNVLPAPNGATSITLSLPAGLDAYEWKRANYAPIISNTNSVVTSTVGGYNVRVKAPNQCYSAFSDTFNVISATGINAPDPVSGLIVSTATKTTLKVDWTQNAAPAYNETFFEVYRGTQAGGPYTLIAKVAADIVTYTDANLTPGTNYFYVVRPVNNSAAAATSAEVKGTTAADASNPTAPGSLTLNSIGNTFAYLTWTAATDDAGLSGYEIYANGTLRATVSAATLSTQLTGLTEGTWYSFQVKAKDVANKTSTASNQVTGLTKRANITYKYYTGTWSALPNFNNLTPAQRGKSATPDISVRPSNRNDNFGFLWTGFIHIPADGQYVFATGSDDGSKLYFNMAYSNSATATVNNDGLHGETIVSSTTLNLTKGVYPIAITYFEKDGGETMKVYWTSAAAGAPSRVEIPAQYYMDTATVAGGSPSAPSALTATTVNHRKINLSWTDNSNNETGFEIYRRVGASGAFSIIATNGAGVKTYVDSTVAASTTYNYQVRAIGATGESAMSNTAAATTLAQPTPPAAPSNLQATAASTTAINLTWNDNSNNESGFEIYRSLGDSTNYSLLKTVAANAVSSSDAGLVANTRAYYKVKAIGEGGASALSNYAVARTKTNNPVIADVASQTVRYGTTLEIPLSATDPDNDAFTFSLLNAPAFVTLDATPGNIHLVVSPTQAQQGTYNNIGVIVTDTYAGADTAYFNLLVNDNYAPVIAPQGTVSVDEGTTSVIKLSVTDQNVGETFTWTTVQKPSFVTVTTNADTATLSIAPGYAAAGAYTITMKVADSQGGIATQSFTLNVVDKPTPNYRLMLDFRLNGTSPAPWNPIMDKVTNNLKNDNGEVTDVALEFSDWWWAAGVEGATTNNNSGVYPDAVMGQYMYFGSLPGFFTGAPVMHGKLKGLETNRTYAIKFFSSSKWWAPQPDNGSTQFTINGVNKVLYAHNNTANTVVFDGIQPNAAGEISFECSIPAGGQVGYLNAMEVIAGGAGTPVNRAPVITDITNQSVQVGTTASVAVVATDADNDPITYTTQNLPSFVTLVQNAGQWSLQIAPATGNEGTYSNIKVIATDPSNASDETTFTLTVTATPPPPADFKLYLSFRLNGTPPSPWNPILEKTTNNLKDDANTTTDIDLIFDTWWWAAFTEGATTYFNTGVYPDAVMSQCMYFGSLPGYFNGAMSMPGKLTNLPAGKKYSIKFFSSCKWWAPQPDCGTTTYTINGVTKSLYVHNNTTNTIEFTDIEPNANGEISFTVGIPTGGQVGFLNAMEISASSASQGATGLVAASGQSLQGKSTAAPDEMSVGAYPNPFTNLLAVDVDLPKAGNLLVEVVDLAGRQLYAENRSNMPAGRSTIRLNNLGSLAGGIYVLKLTTNYGAMKTVKVIKQKNF